MSVLAKVRRPVALLVIMVTVPIVVLALLEGGASLLLFGRAYRRSRRAEDNHVERDTLLGWVNKANVHRPDLYGRGIGLTTNAQRFRHSGEVGAKPPEGRRRVVCSGDSFTLGYGVGDEQTWCAALGARAPLETVNMGQGGYGIDQAYLWYVRDGLPLRPDVHLFAFVLSDFHRMQRETILGYPKPRLALSGDGVRATGVPVPGPGLGPALFRLSMAARTLKTYQVLERFLPGGAGAREDDSRTWEVAHAALRDLERRDRGVGAKLVVVFLPMRPDFDEEGSSTLRGWLRDSGSRNEIAYVDLVEPLRRLPPQSIGKLFLRDGALPFAGAAGHYTAEGNAWVADQLLRLVPELGGAPPADATPAPAP